MSVINLQTPGVVPNVETMKATAKALGIKMPRGRAKPMTIVKALREGFAKRLEDVPEDDWVKCPVCGEVTDDADEIEVCPFCGDAGLEEGEESPETAATGEDEGTSPESIKADEVDEAAGEAAPDPEEPPVADLGVDEEDPAMEPPDDEPEVAESGTDLAKGSEAMLAALEVEKEIINREQTNMVGAGYELGMSIRRVREKNLWKAEGHKTFRKFCESVGISHTLAYSLVDMTKKFDKETFLKIGRRKLQIVARADVEDQDELLDDAKGGASVRDLEDKAQEKRNGKTDDDKPDKPADPNAGKPGRPSREDQTITLLAKVGGKAKVYPFRDRTSQDELEKWAADSYAQIQLSDEVFLLIALKTNSTGEPVSVMATFRRATTKADTTPEADTDEAASAAAE